MKDIHEFRVRKEARVGYKQVLNGLSKTRNNMVSSVKIKM